MRNFKARPHFEDRQMVQWMGESINLSGQTNFDLGSFNSYIYDSYEDFLNGVSGTTFLSLPYSASTDPVSGWSNQTVYQPGIIRITPPRKIFFSGNTNVITATTQEDVTDYVATSLDSDGTLLWKPLSGVTATSCVPNFLVTTISPCLTGGTVSVDGNFTVMGNFIVSGITSASTTIIETEIVKVEDNNIELNYGGNHTTAVGGGVTVISGQSSGQHSTIYTNSDGVWIFDPGLSATTIPYIYDGVGSNNNIIPQNGGNNVSSGSTNSSIGGGGNNIVSASTRSSVVGGRDNLVSGSNDSTIGGGYGNSISSSSHYSTIGGGYKHKIDDVVFGFVVGGIYNYLYRGTSTDTNSSSIIGGENNFLKGGRASSIIGSIKSTISGNTVNDNTTIIGGYQSQILHDSGNSGIIGSNSSLISDSHRSFILGGQSNTIGGGSDNSIILGGSSNRTILGADTCFTVGTDNVSEGWDNVFILGNSITSSTATFPQYSTFVNKLNIYDTPSSGSSENLLVRESDGEVAYRTISSMGGVIKYVESVSLTGGTPQTITHSLGSSSVIVQAKDPSGDLSGILVGSYTTTTVDVEASITGVYEIIIIG